MKFITLPLFLLSTGISAFSQNSNQDTATTFNPLKPTIHYSSWNVRVCNGIQRSYYFDLGISREYFIGSGHGNTGSDIFLAYSMFPSFHKDIPSVYGVKGGIDIVGNGVILGLEAGYYSSSKANNCMITPKVGLGFGVLNVIYGYGFSTNHKTISRIGKHTVALQCNIPFISKNKMKKQ